MGQLAVYVKSQFDRLAKEFVHNLNAVSFYADIPDQVKQNIAHTYLTLTLGSLETRDIAPLAEFLRARAKEALSQGLSADVLLQALNVYEKLFWPLVDSADDAQFLGLATSQLRDVVSREIAAQLIRSECEFRDLFERSPVGILRFTAEGQIVQANPAFLRLVGYDSIDAINRIGGMSTLYQDQADLERLLDLLSQGPVSDQEFVFCGPAGQTIWVSLSAGLIAGPQGQIIEGIVQDIGERKLAEERAHRRLTQLRAVTESTVLLSTEQDADTLCRRAVELGRERLSIDRMSIWLNDGPPGDFRGTFGIDEQGRVRDERTMRLDIGADSPWGKIVSGVWSEEIKYTTLRDHLGNPVGDGWRVSLPVLGAKKNILGVLVADQLFSHREWDDYIVEILKLYGLSIGQLLESVSMLETAARAQQMLRLVVDTIPQLIFWKDRRSVFMGCNQRFAHVAGFESPEQVIGLTDYDVVWTREQSDAYVRDDREVMESGKPKLHILEQQLQADGRRVWLETNKVPLFDQQGNVAGVLGTAIDVTERMEALESARTAQQMLQAVIDNIPQTVFWKDRNLVFLGCNKAFAHAARLDSPADVIGKTDYDLVWADMAEQFRAEDRAVIESGESIINREVIRVFSDGRQQWSLQNKFLLRDETGQVWGILGTSENITERKLVEIRLRENEARLALALEAANAGVWEMRPQQNRVYMDARWFALLDYGPDELPQSYETWVTLLHPEERETVEAQVQRYIQQGVDFGLDFRMRAKGGEYRWIHSIGKVIERNPDGSAAHLAGTHTDVTASMQRDRERVELYVRRTEEVRLSTQVAQEIAAAPSLEELFARVVTLIKERFGYYHVQIFRYDPEREAMLLVTGYSEIGARMLAAGYRLPRGVGLVGMAAEVGQSVLVTDVCEDPNWQPNPNLPETRGELAVPIRWRDQVLGILDVQSNRAGELDQDDQLVLEGLCGQIAIAIQNTQAIQEAQTFRLLVESAGQGIGIATLDGRIYYTNKALLEIVGESQPSAFLGRPLLDYAAEHERRRLTEEILPQVMQGESWQGEIAVRSHSGRLVPTLHSLFALRDEQGRLRFLADVVTDVTENKRVQAEMQERLQELNTLYRQLSEQGWQVFREQGMLPGGYLYDGAEARRADQLWLPEIAEAVHAGNLVVTTYEEPVAVAPLSAPGGETVGVLGVFDDPASPLPPEDLELVESVAAEVAQALEGARLSLQMQVALAETGALYQASAALNAAQTFDEILNVLRANTEIGQADSNVSINLFNHPWVGDDLPEWILVLARWTQLEASATLPRYPLRTFSSIRTLLRPDQPTIIEDVWTDERMDEALRNLYAKQFRARSILFVPLVVAGSWIGFLNAIFSRPRKFTSESLRRITTLVGQAAVAVESIRRLQETQARAQREQQLREIAARLRAQPDVEGVLRTLARELGQVVGRRTFVSVSNLEALTETIGARPVTTGGNGHAQAAAEEVK